MTGDDSVRGAEGPAAPSQLESDTVGAVATAAAEAAAKKRKVKRRDLKAKIRALEAEIEETRSQVPDEPLYGMTPKLEGAIVRALEQQRYPVIPRLLRPRSEEHTSELQSLMRISNDVFCLKKKNSKTHTTYI